MYNLFIMSDVVCCVMLPVDICVSMIFFLRADIVEAELEEEEGRNLARKVGEAVTNTFGVVVTAIDIPLGEFCLKQNLRWILT